MQEFYCPRMQDVITKLADRFGYDLVTPDGEFSVGIPDPNVRDLVVEVREGMIWVGYWEGWEDCSPNEVGFLATSSGWTFAGTTFDVLVDDASFMFGLIDNLASEIETHFLSNPLAQLRFQRVEDVAYDVDASRMDSP